MRGTVAVASVVSLVAGAAAVLVFSQNRVGAVPDQLAMDDAHRTEPAAVPSSSSTPREISLSVERQPKAAQRENSQCDKLQFENTLLRGQLAALGGLPNEWPTALPMGVASSDVDSWVTSSFTEADGLMVARLDCDEYPCLAAIAYDEDLPSSSEPIEQQLADFEATYPDASVRPHIQCAPDGCFAVLAFTADGQGPGEADFEARMAIRRSAFIETAFD
jgi:hypothetical protein